MLYGDQKDDTGTSHTYYKAAHELFYYGTLYHHQMQRILGNEACFQLLDQLLLQYHHHPSFSVVLPKFLLLLYQRQREHIYNLCYAAESCQHTLF